MTVAALDPVRLDAQLGETDWTVLPPGTTRDQVRAPSGLLARITSGPPGAPRVVLVPGATGSKEDFLLMIPLLVAAGYRVESFDLAGQYESAGAGPENLTPPGESYQFGEFVADLIAVLDDGATPVHLLGYSFAGTVAAAGAVRRPDLVSTLTLLSTPPIAGRALGGFKRVGRLIGRAGPRLSAAVMLQGLRWNVTRVGPQRQAFVRARLRYTRRSSVRDIIGLMADTPDLAPGVRAAGIPTLVAVGSGDLWPVEAHRAFATAMDATFVVYRTGHSPCETAPHQLVADLLRLFRSIDQPS
jgi:pimeloyl-ACP methyl ester carboxylesterase